jgi:beta-glucanase (GH16 family)
MTFRDEFAGPAGRPPDSRRWVRDLGNNGWGNNELETYTDGACNAFLDGVGHLVIEARRQPGTPPVYTSARLKTKGTFAQTYGKFECRLKLPSGQGIWPAFWLLGDNFPTAGWPQCGEIDIMEFIGRDPHVNYATAHGPGYSGDHGIQGKFDFRRLPKSPDGFHTFTLEWLPGRMTWFVDGRKYHEMTPSSIRPKRWVFNHPFFIIVNMAVGGGFAGYPDKTSNYPQRFVVDYVRCYQDANLKFLKTPEPISTVR